MELSAATFKIEIRAVARMGFIGLGSQGGPMARRIIDAGHPVTLWARNSKTLEPFADTDAEIARSVAEFGARVEHVGICVVDDAGVKQICDQLIPSMRPGGCIMVHSTVRPALCRELAKDASARGIALLDAPVSGGGVGAAAGTLTVMVGGDAAALQTVRPILETFAGLIVHLGDVGSGQNAKLVNNTLMAAHTALGYYALTAAETLGIDRAALVELVKFSSGRSYGFEVYARQPGPGAFKHGASLLQKDLLLLEDALGDATAFSPFRELTMPFIDLVLNASTPD